MRGRRRASSTAPHLPIRVAFTSFDYWTAPPAIIRRRPSRARARILEELEVTSFGAQLGPEIVEILRVLVLLRGGRPELLTKNGLFLRIRQRLGERATAGLAVHGDTAIRRPLCALLLSLFQHR